jgi:hypothetical protein
VDPVSRGVQKIAPVLVFARYQDWPIYDLVAVADPMSRGAQKIAPVLEVRGPRVAGRSEDPSWSSPGTRIFLSMTWWLLRIPCRGALRRLLPSWRFFARYQAFPIYDLVAVVDPVLRGAQKIAPVLEVLLQVPGFSYL